MNFKRITVNDLINHLKISRDNFFDVDVRLTFADISFIIERLKGGIGNNGRN